MAAVREGESTGVQLIVICNHLTPLTMNGLTFCEKPHPFAGEEQKSQTFVKCEAHKTSSTDSTIDCSNDNSPLYMGLLLGVRLRYL